MGQPFFRFRQFTIWHHLSSMPVGTDGVLVGAWATVKDANRILDIGTGSGLVALMAAQRAPQANVTGIDIDAASVCQAEENVRNSPFASRVQILQADVRTYKAQHFDSIISNPPFFQNDVLPPSKRRCQARNASALPSAQLIEAVERLLSPQGSFSMVLPTSSQAGFIAEALAAGLYLSRTMLVRTVSGKPAKRVLLEFTRHRVACQSSEEMLLQLPDGSRSPDYASLTSEFYL